MLPHILVQMSQRKFQQISRMKWQQNSHGNYWTLQEVHHTRQQIWKTLSDTHLNNNIHNKDTVYMCISKNISCKKFCMNQCFACHQVMNFIGQWFLNKLVIHWFLFAGKAKVNSKSSIFVPWKTTGIDCLFQLFTVVSIWYALSWISPQLQPLGTQITLSSGSIPQRITGLVTDGNNLEGSRIESMADSDIVECQLGTEESKEFTVQPKGKWQAGNPQFLWLSFL